MNNAKNAAKWTAFTLSYKRHFFAIKNLKNDNELSLTQSVTQTV